MDRCEGQAGKRVLGIPWPKPRFPVTVGDVLFLAVFPFTVVSLTSLVCLWSSALPYGERVGQAEGLHQL